ncbi:hypothetical protein SB816_30995, partial [Achromobacter sp. SIMBA_011]|uniref:hypothetical protein n=1 Tax=Achromobacter sp. SIMBA_011 TaxID=3085759 RepID=UPI00397B6A0D
TGALSTASASTFNTTPQTVANGDPFSLVGNQFLNNVTFTAPDTFTVQESGNYYISAQVSSASGQAGPVGIGVNAVLPNQGTASGLVNGTSTGEQ